MFRKVKRIFFKTVGSLALLILLLAVGIYFGVQSYIFQTWLGKRAGNYLSDELKSKVYVDKIELDFFSKAYLKGILILDKHKDTLFSGDLDVLIQNFNFDEKKFDLKSVTLNNATSKIIQYKKDSLYNFDFIASYFTSSKKDTSKSTPWLIKFGDVNLNNVTFNYRNENKDTSIARIINYNNILLKHTYGKVSHFKINDDTLLADISGLKTKEQSGFELQNLSTSAKVSSQKLLCTQLYLKTPTTLVKGTIDFSYKSWDDYSDFINKVNINSVLEDSTQADFADIAYFTDELKGLDKRVKLSGKVKGYISELILSGFKFEYGSSTRFNGNLTLSGLPDFSTSYLHFDAKELSTSYNDIVSIPSYPFKENKKLSLPIELQRLGKISYRGKFDGFTNDFTTHGNFTTNLGKLATSLSIKLGKSLNDITYNGKIKTENFNLGTLLGQKDFNALSLNCSIKGKGLSVNSLNTILEGEIHQLMYNNYAYKNIKLNGSFSDKLFSGLLVSQDPNANFDFNGTINFNNKVPEMDFISTINNLKLNELNFTNKNDSGSFSSQILINIKGDNLDNLSGQINFDNTSYKTKAHLYKLSTFDVQLDQSEQDKKIKLNSAYINASVKGKYAISNLYPAFENLLVNYYPSYFSKPKSVKTYSDEVEFKLTVKKFNVIKELFLPDLMLSPGSSVDGNFNAKEKKLNIQFSSSQLDYQSFNLKDVLFTLTEKDSTVSAQLSSTSLKLSDSLHLLNLSTSLQSVNKNTQYQLVWDNLKQPSSKGEIAGKISLDNEVFKLSNDKISITMNDSVWNMTQAGSLTIDKKNKLIFSPISFSNKQQSVNLSGILSQNTGDSLVITTNHLILDQFNPLLEIVKLKLKGEMNSSLSLSNAGNNLVFDGNLNLNKFELNDNLLGELSINTNYVTNQKLIRLNGYTSLGLQDDMGNQVKNISFNGVYYLDRKEESIDVNFNANPANLKLLNPLLEGVITIKNGFVNGEGKIHGTPDKIKLDGKLHLFNSEVKVDYTNVTYNITGDIEIMPDQIRFSDLLMREKGLRSSPQGTVNGNIFHTNFSRIQLDYDITYRNMLVLNTTEKENKLFYGKVYGTGNVGIYGFLNNLHMQVRDTTARNSRFFLPLDGPAEISEDDFIRFVKKDTIKVVKETASTGFNLDLTIYATPNTTTQIILDKQNGDVLNVQGQGELNMRINTLGKFEMFGDYIITSGDYLFTLENVINKKFDIDAGSSISWSGDPLNADINVSTSYKQRASVAPLLNDTTGNYKGRFPVDCKLLLTDKLFSPLIKFAIEFPNIDATAKARITNVLSDDVELNRQVFSFLLFRTFVTPQIFNANGGGVTAGNAAASTGSELLSNRVSEFLNTYFGNLTGLKDVQLGLNYRPGTQSNSEAVDLALSKQFFNNKVSVDGNFGVNNNQARNSNGLIGDVNINYKLSDDGRYRLKGFNRTNDNTQTAINGGAYTQGIGFFYREEFETFNQLFSSYLKKLKKKN
jgi:hypothetical protein